MSRPHCSSVLFSSFPSHQASPSPSSSSRRSSLHPNNIPIAPSIIAQRRTSKLLPSLVPTLAHSPVQRPSSESSWPLSGGIFSPSLTRASPHAVLRRAYRPLKSSWQRLSSFLTLHYAQHGLDIPLARITAAHNLDFQTTVRCIACPHPPFQY